MISLDASAVVELLLSSPAGERVARRIETDGGPFHVPHLIDTEVVSALARLVRVGKLDRTRAAEALQELELLPFTRHPHLPLVPRIWDLRNNLTAYDAAYVSLAEIFACPLVTADGALARSPGHGARVELA